MPNLNYWDLTVRERYILSSETPLMPELNPQDPHAALNKVKQIPPNGVIRILAVSKRGGTPWYNVSVLKGRTKTGSGWINSTALIGQDLEIKK
jgi:hypothetical protein